MTNKAPSNAISFSSCPPSRWNVLSNIWICSAASEAQAHLGSAGWVEEGGPEEPAWGLEPRDQVTPCALSGRDRSERTCDLDVKHHFHSSQGFDPREVSMRHECCDPEPHHQKNTVKAAGRQAPLWGKDCSRHFPQLPKAALDWTSVST